MAAHYDHVALAAGDYMVAGTTATALAFSQRHDQLSYPHDGDARD